MKNYTYGKHALFGLLVLIMISGKLKSQSEILGHTYLGAFNGHTYYMSDCPTAWYDALFSAEEMGGYLATITSQEEDDFLAQFAPYIDCQSLVNGYNDRIGGAWIGLLTNDNDQDGICQMVSWINGETIGYTNWSPGYEWETSEPPTGYCGPAGIIGYPGGNNVGFCYPYEYSWFTNFYTNATSRYIVEFDQDPACSQSNKTYVCHNGNTLCINQTSLQNHLNHGDYAGPCGPCNANALSTPDVHVNSHGSNISPVRFDPENGNREDGKYSLSHLSIFPNPTTDEMQVDLRSRQNKSMIRLYLSTGEKVHEQTFQNVNVAFIDVSSLPPGIILVEVRSGEEIWMGKVVKL